MPRRAPLPLFLFLVVIVGFTCVNIFLGTKVPDHGATRQFVTHEFVSEAELSKRLRGQVDNAGDKEEEEASVSDEESKKEAVIAHPKKKEESPPPLKKESAKQQQAPDPQSKGQEPPFLIEASATPLPTFKKLERSFCKYEGHCLGGTTCVVDSKSKLRGACEPYYHTSDKTMTKDPITQELETNDCARQCMEQLEWDEQFLFESVAVVHSVDASTPGMGHRPDGCIITYHRQGNKTTMDDSSLLDGWKNASAAHRIVRIDALPTSEKQQQSWVALCYHPCKASSECGEGFICTQQESCVRDDDFWMPTEEEKHDMVIVSGANNPYFVGLKNLAASLCYWAPHNKLVVYNLGMTESQLEEIRTWTNVLDLKWPDGIPDSFPPHVHASKKYAWKPIAMNESVHEYNNIFWLDAGSTVTGPITPAEEITHDTGIFLVKGQDLDMNQKLNPEMYEWFNLTKETFVGGPSFSGNTQAYLYPSRYIDTIVKPNAACALDEACIAPKGSLTKNHRFDQASLSILAYTRDVQAPHHTERLAADRKQLDKDVSKPNYRFVWTSRKAAGNSYVKLAGEKCNIK